MKTKIGAVVATLAAAASAAGAAVWARRKRDHKRLERKRRKTSKARASSPNPSGATASGQAPAAAPARSRAGTVADVPKAVPAEASDVAAIDELRSIKGLGARSSERLAAVGVTTLAQVAAWSDADIDEIAPRIHVGAERIRREDWVGQAQAATRG
jgi:predicted flap endonuclease-1-like 5' DNA nuclease